MNAYIFEAIRTPRGKGRKGGALTGTRPIELVATLLHELRRRTESAEKWEDLILGCSTQTGEQGANLAKIAAVYAGLPNGLSGATVNRFCASSLEAVHMAAAKVATGMAELVVAGGVESMSRVPMLSDQGAWFADPEVAKATGFVHMGVAADLVATLEGFTRDELDAFAAESHRRAAEAWKQGHFAKSIVPVKGPDGRVVLAFDENVRGDSTTAKLSTLAASFADPASDAVVRARYPNLSAVNHLHTVATAPAVADGASLLLVGTEEAGRRHGLTPRARILAFADHSVEPVLMLTGNVGAVTKALAKAGRKVSDVDVFEVNESFAAIPLHFRKVLEIEPNRLNPNGGAIAMGHALGSSGGTLLGTCLDELERTGGRLGVASICAGAGLAAATVIERL